MSVGRDSGDFDGMLARAQRFLDDASTGGAGAPDAATVAVSGRGAAGDGQVSATVVRGGRVDRIEIDPRAMRLPSQDLARAVADAVNAALDDLAAQVAAVGRSGEVPDLARLAEQVREVQDDGLRQMARFVGALDAAMARLGQR